VSAGHCRLILLRHGQSEWNEKNLFTGWMNPGLTAGGERQAVLAGQSLAEQGLLPAAAHTSMLGRAIGSASLLLAAMDRDWIPVRRSWQLNGQHYGALQGKDKTQAIAQFGERQVRLWRRSYDNPPPPAPADMQRLLFSDPRYAGLSPYTRPNAESLKAVTARLLPYWYDAIVPDLLSYGCVLIVSHGNALRALVKHLDATPDEAVGHLEIPNAVPLVYEFDSALHSLMAGGRYLRREAPAQVPAWALHSGGIGSEELVQAGLGDEDRVRLARDEGTSACDTSGRSEIIGSLY